MLLQAGPVNGSSPIRLFCVDGHTILSVFLDAREDNSQMPVCTVVVRDQTGRQVQAF